MVESLMMVIECQEAYINMYNNKILIYSVICDCALISFHTIYSFDSFINRNIYCILNNKTWHPKQFINTFSKGRDHKLKHIYSYIMIYSF